MLQLEHSAIVLQTKLQATHTEMQRLHTQNVALIKEEVDLRVRLARANVTLAKLQAVMQSQSMLLASTQNDNAELAQYQTDHVAEVAAVNQQLNNACTQFEHYQDYSAAQRTEERQLFERHIALQDHELGNLRRRLEHMTEENARLERVSNAQGKHWDSCGSSSTLPHPTLRNWLPDASW